MTKMHPKSRRRGERPAPSRGPLLLAAVGVVVLGLVAVLAWRASAQAASAGPGRASGSPSLKADRTRVDLGDVRLGETVSVSFELTNTGTGPLRFSEAPWVEVVEGC
jgi:hypothetical protein